MSLLSSNFYTFLQVLVHFHGLSLFLHDRQALVTAIDYF